MPSNKMERFTEQAWRVLEFAEAEAQFWKREYIDTEHMLLGMMQPWSSLPGLWAWLGVERSSVEEQIHQVSRPKDLPTNLPELSPDIKRAIELAVQEVRDRKHHYVHPEHLLLGLTHFPECNAMSVLNKLGIGASEVRRQTERMLNWRDKTNRLQQPVKSVSSPLTSDKMRRENNVRLVIENTKTNNTIVDLQINLGQFERGIIFPIKAALFQAEPGHAFVLDNDASHRISITLEKANT